MTKTLNKIKEMAGDVYQKILKKKQPSMTFPLRALNNVKYDPKKGFFELLGKVKIRTLSVNTVKTFAQTLRMMAISKDLIATDDMATKREVYYVSKNWGDARFHEQPESLSCEENVAVRIDGNFRIVPAKEVVNYAFKHGDIIKKGRKVSVEKLEMYSVSFDQDMRLKEHKIKYVHKHPSRKLIKIMSTSGREVAVTPFHSLFTINEQGIIESKNASNISDKDFIAIPRRLKVETNKTKINLLNCFLESDENVYLYFHNTFSFDKVIKSPNLRMLKDYINGNYVNGFKRVIYQWRIRKSIPLNVIKHLDHKTLFEENVSIFFPEGKIKIQAEIKKDYHLGFILGLLLSEGTNCKVDRNPRERHVHLSNKSRKILNDFTNSFTKVFGKNSLNNKPVKSKDGTYRLRVGYRLLSLILENNFEYKAGTKSWDKKVPSVLFDAPDSCIKGFIKGFWLGDGSKNYSTYRIHSTSRELIEGINFLLLRKGILCKVYEHKKRKEHHHKPYELKIANLDSIRLFGSIVEGKSLHRNVKSTFSGDRIPNMGIIVNNIRRSCSKKLPHKVIKMLDWYTMEKENRSISRQTLKKVLDTFAEFNPQDKHFSLLQKYVKGDICWDRVKNITFLPEPSYTMDFTVNPAQNFIGGKGFVLLHNSDLVMDDVEAMFMVNREQLGFSADEHGGDVAGELVVIDKNPDTKKVIKIDCTKFGSGAYSIPTSVEHLEFETDAKFILAIETKGMFERLNRHNYWKKAHCVIISMGGVPSRACRRFIRKLADEKKLPVYVFSDGDPYGWASIYRTLKVGSGNAAHINEFFCVPQARFLGITAQDIIDYKLPTHPLKDVDLKKIKDLFKNDPFIQSHKEWAKELKLLEQMGKRAEQQSLAAHGLNFVMEKYLPQKLKHPEKFLP